MFDIDAYRDDVTALVRAASRRALEWYRQPIAVDNKHHSGFDPVTEADRVVEAEIRAGLRALFPGHAILGEEEGSEGDGPLRWVIDPIDGTRAFVIGQPMWGTLLGFEIEGRPVAGWMHQPVLDETHVATPGGGLLHRGEVTSALVTSGCRELASAVVLCTHPEMFAPGREQVEFARLESATRMVRYSGDCVNYGLLAAGHADLVVENQLAPYDIIPLIPIVEAAGGIVTDREGNPPVGGGYVVAAATEELHAAALAVLAGSG